MATYQPRKTRTTAAAGEDSPSAIDAILNATGEMQAIQVDPADVYVDVVQPLPIVIEDDTVEPEPVDGGTAPDAAEEVSSADPADSATAADPSSDAAPLDKQQAADLAAQISRPVEVPVVDPPSTKDQKALILGIAGGVLVVGGIAALVLTRRK